MDKMLFCFHRIILKNFYKVRANLNVLVYFNCNLPAGKRHGSKVWTLLGVNFFSYLTSTVTGITAEVSCAQRLSFCFLNTSRPRHLSPFGHRKSVLATVFWMFCQFLSSFQRKEKTHTSCSCKGGFFSCKEMQYVWTMTERYERINDAYAAYCYESYHFLCAF